MEDKWIALLLFVVVPAAGFLLVHWVGRKIEERHMREAKAEADAYMRMRYPGWVPGSGRTPYTYDNRAPALHLTDARLRCCEKGTPEKMCAECAETCDAYQNAMGPSDAARS